MPAKTGPEKQQRWREANAEIAAFEHRMHKLANALIRCERRIIYAGKNLEDAPRPSIVRKHKAEVEVWKARREEHRAAMRAIIDG